MLDGAARRLIDPALDRAGRALADRGVTANAVTLAGFALGLAAAAAAAANRPGLALFAMIISRIADGLDGAVAKATRRTDLGGYLDIVLDFIFYGAFPLGFALADPQANAMACAILLFSFYANGASFLAYAILAERRGLASDDRGPKSIYFTTGLAEATETIAVFAVFCIFPGHFAGIAMAFAILCLYTALSRIVLAARAFRAGPPAGPS